MCVSTATLELITVFPSNLKQTCVSEAFDYRKTIINIKILNFYEFIIVVSSISSFLPVPYLRKTKYFLISSEKIVIENHAHGLTRILKEERFVFFFQKFLLFISRVLSDI